MNTAKDIFKNSNIYSFFKYFIANTVGDIEHGYDMSFIKFIFNIEDIELFSSKLDMDNEHIRDGINILKRNYNEYTNNKDEDTYYIKIDDSYRFFYLLDRIFQRMLNTDNKKENSRNIIRSIWLRMNAEDFDHVNTFLERQLNFLYGDKLFDGDYKVFKKYDNYKLVYDDNANEDYFETNNHIELSLINKDYTKGKEREKYSFPVVHYAINYEEGKPVCYIYGIQSLGNQRKDENVKEVLKAYKKKLRNSKVSPEFVLTLKLFIDLIEEYGVTDIRVPLLQILNYPYHEQLSKAVENQYGRYTEEEIQKYEEMDSNENYNASVLEYVYTKSAYDKFADKEDIISKNKTERLIDTFMIMEEKYHNIRFLNEPFIEGDTLLIKINNEKSVNKQLVK